MQTETEPEKMDYDELTLNNPLLAEIEAETTADTDGKGKQRRYWTPKEEERFFEIWGRDNWRLTRHGKNTVYFAHWSNELKERFSIDVKPEEIQTKVNQTRAKFRQVKKHLDLDKNATRWKKYDIIDKILKNQYRPEDAEPVPQEALENNRDISADELTNVGRQSTPTSSASNSTQDAVIAQVAGGAGVVANEQQINLDPSEINVNLDLSLNEPNMSGGLFNASGDSQSRANYSTELFSDQIEEIKQEFEEEKKQDEFQSEYQSYQQQYQETNHYNTPEPELHQLQTPQQQQLQQQQQHQQIQTQYQQPQQYSAEQPEAPPSSGTSPNTSATVAQQHLQQHVQQLRQQQQGVFEHTPNAYTNPATGLDSQAATPATAIPAIENRSVLLNNQPSANAYTNSNYTATNNNNNHTNMQPPRPTQQRKRRGSAIHNTSVAAPNAVSAAAALADSVESQYLEEVRKRNHILDEQKDISRQRLQLEERKVSLMEQFFPKYLELQEQILLKLNAN